MAFQTEIERADRSMSEIDDLLEPLTEIGEVRTRRTDEGEGYGDSGVIVQDCV